MSGDQPMRRRSHVEMPVAYAAVGASRAPDLLRFPPEGSTPYEEEQRLGSGQDRFIMASAVLMTWGAQRGAGIRIVDVVRGTDAPYAGPSFDPQGVPEAAGAVEEHFGPDGEPYIVAGTTAELREAGQDPRRVLVVYTVDEDRRVGFAWGTGDENGAIGEQLFLIEHRDDDTVWAVARGFLTAPKNGLLGLKARSDLRTAIDSAKRQISVLAPGGITDAAVVSDPADPATGDPGTAPGAAPDVDIAPDPEPGAASEPKPAGEADAAPGADSASAPNPAPDPDAPIPTHQRRPSRPKQ